MTRDFNQRYDTKSSNCRPIFPSDKTKQSAYSAAVSLTGEYCSRLDYFIRPNVFLLRDRPSATIAVNDHYALWWRTEKADAESIDTQYMRGVTGAVGQ